MKKMLSLILTAALTFSLSTGVFAAKPVVVLSTQSLSMNGTPVNCEKYNINGENYFKLRDIAAMMQGTNSSFEVGFEEVTRTVSVTTGMPYSPNGSELNVSGGDKSATAIRSDMPLVINGQKVTDLTAYLIGGNNYFRLRDLNEKLNFLVSYDEASRTVLLGSADSTLPAPTPTPTPSPTPAPAQGETVSYQSVKMNGVTADVLTVNISNPGVHLKTVQTDNTIGATKAFSQIVKESGALAVITGNFMSGQNSGNYPLGHVMVDGELRYVGNGLTSVGVTESGDVRWGRPTIRTWIKPAGGGRQEWTALAVNLQPDEQPWNYSVLYTPAFGSQASFTESGKVMTVSGGKVTAWTSVNAGDSVSIPSDGYILWMDYTYMNEFVWEFQAPQIGQRVEREYYLYEADSEGFRLDGVKYIFSGGPRLVKNGQIETYLEPQFDQARFIGNYSSSRTAVGSTADGKLIFVSTGGATIDQMRELMLGLGCVNAVNLDGGASTGFYYNGKTYRTPGRNLATTVQIFVD